MIDGSRGFHGPQKKAVAVLASTIVPILEEKVEEFERVINNDKKHNLFSAYRQLSRSLDLINHVSDRIAGSGVSIVQVLSLLILLYQAGFVAEELEIPWITTMATNLQSKLIWSSLLLRRGWESRARRRKKIKHYAVNSRIGKYCRAFTLTQTLKTLQFQVVQSKWSGDHLLSLCHL